MRCWKKFFIRYRKSKLKGDLIWVEVEGVPVEEAAVVVQEAAAAAVAAAPEAALLVAVEAVYHVVSAAVHHADLAVAAVQRVADR